LILYFSYPQIFTKEGRKTADHPYSQALSSLFKIQGCYKSLTSVLSLFPVAWQNKQSCLPALQQACGDK
jgi:hypothetical protein